MTPPYRARPYTTAREQPIRLIAILTLPVIVVMLALIYAYFAHDIRASLLLRDPNALANQPVYYGFVSNVGVVLWIVAATVPLYTSLAIHERRPAVRQKPILVSGGLFTAMLGLDDLFMFHDGLARLLDIPDLAVMTFYVVLAVAWLIVLARRIAETEWLILCLGVSGLAVSLFMDLFVTSGGGGTRFLEDMAKLGGLVFWMTYFLRLSWQSLTPVVAAVGTHATRTKLGPAGR